ncbi:ThiF family adenylyltransferase [Bradyrhizobium sp. STM 3562]|uniref:ThiF family adenylyltransferase n=1 Tax=Bradyrhizobium sp. STM 3562 TaxID=578924 RepID=UPI0038903181
MSNFNLVFVEQSEAELRDLVFATKGVEGAAYVLMRECKIANDPWERRSRTKLVVREIVPIPPEHKVSSTGQHVTWDTRGFVALLQRCQREELVLGIAHCHPHGPRDFSDQDDKNETELLRTACNRNGPGTKLVSILFFDDGGIRARVWQSPKHSADCKSVAVFGERFRFHFPTAPSPASEVFARQVLAFGPSLMSQLKALRVGVIGGGGTGSATAMLTARAGASQIVIVDDDIVEPTNLNRHPIRCRCDGQ